MQAIKKALLYIRTKSLRNKVLNQKMDKGSEQVCLLILDRDFEEAMGIFSTICLLQNISGPSQKFFYFFLNHPYVFQTLRRSKVRYYEFFLAMIESAKRTDFSKKLYNDKEDDIQYIRKTIALSGVDKLIEKGLFRDRLYEWGLIFKRKIPRLTKTLLQNKLEKENLNNDAELFKALIKLFPLYFLRFMECPDLEILQRGLKVVRFLEKKKFL